MSNLIVSAVQKTYDNPNGLVSILNNVSLQVNIGETLAIIGPSGSGKSTLLNIIGSLDKPTSGTVIYGDINITTLEGQALSKFRSTEVGFIFQDHHLLPQLTVIENVLVPTISTPYTPNASDRAFGLLSQMGIESKANSFPAQLSGGERQRVAVARALVNGAKLLLCDEPTGNLDRAAGETVISILLELAAQQRAIVLMVTHNIAQAQRFSRCIQLTDGRLSAFGGDQS